MMENSVKKTEQLKVSVIVPAYNCEKYIGECVDSILKQTYQNTEIIVINDGSTDHTKQILESYGSKINLVNKENGGVSVARNTGISVATGDYLMFVDSDDWIDECMIEEMLKHVNDGSVVRCGILLEDENGSKPLISYCNDSIYQPDAVKNLFIHTYSLSNPVAQLIKKEDIKHLFKEGVTYGEDFLFNYLNFRNSSVYQMSAMFYHYRMIDSSTTNSLNISKIDKICDDVLTVYPYLIKYDDCQDSLYRVVKELNKGFVRVFKNHDLSNIQKKGVIEKYWVDKRLTFVLERLTLKTIIKNGTPDILLIICIKLKIISLYVLMGEFLYGLLYRLIK